MQYFGARESRVIYDKKLRKSDQITWLVADTLGLDSLKDFYFNECIMPTSGTEYFLTLNLGQQTKKISLHSYYIGQVQNLIDRMNSYLPKEYQCHYESKNNKQDCKP